MKIIFFLLVILLTSGVNAQKMTIDHTVYNDWKSLKNHKISNDGKFVSYEISPHQGDGYLYIYDIANDELDSIPRGTSAQFSGNSGYLAFKITPGYDTLRTCDLDKVDKKKWPKDSLGIYIFATDSILKFGEIQSFEVNDESDWMTFLSFDNKLTKPAGTDKKRKKRRRKKKNEREYTSTGKALSVYNPISDKKYQYKDVKSFEMSENAQFIAYAIHQKDEFDSMYMSILNTATSEVWLINQKYTDIQNMVFNDQVSHMAFLTSSDSAKTKVYAVRTYDIGMQLTTLVASEGQSFLPEGDAASVNYTPVFTKAGDRLYFGAAIRPEEEPKDTLTASEKVKLDIWHHEDKRLQPQQLIELKRDKKETSLYIYTMSSGVANRLSDDTLSVSTNDDPRGEFVLGRSNERYAHTYNWVIPYPEDYYQVSLLTGERKLIKAGVTYGGDLSPTGQYFAYYDGEAHNYMSIDLLSGKEECLTCKIDNVLWEDDVNGMPMDPYPFGITGWKEGEEKVYIQSEMDIWEYDYTSKNVASVTNELGSEKNIELSPRKWSHDSVYVDFDNVYVQGFDRKTKGIHFYAITSHGNHTDLNETSYYDANVRNIIRSKDKSQIILKKMTTVEYPDLHLADNDFKTTKKISITNPQQNLYNWVDVELVDWTSYDGIKLEGLLYKPENYDATKEYPLMVYFYELYSDKLHQHYIPKPTASIIYATEYASAGYLVFIPDIRYKEGHPGQSAYDCILSGTDRILELYPNVDSTRMALQGQSWGGYQTAQLVTMTNRYKAAMAGAPVTNMFSAYGGIRWGSGHNRQFQYEKTQSRIGYTIWEKPELYVENSPQFHLPNVQTPLMIMHNDGDGAVPWYQGIELFTGLKRLGKTAWLLNYNDEQHNLMRNANRMDLSIRMRQFFDHYLQGKEAPEWMIDGIPATVKGKELRY
jgi:dienelactone hydrolase